VAAEFIVALFHLARYAQLTVLNARGQQ